MLRTARREAGACETKKGHHVILIDAVTGHADRTDQRLATIDRHRTREDLDTVGEQYGRRLLLEAAVEATDATAVARYVRRETNDEGDMLVFMDIALRWLQSFRA